MPNTSDFSKPQSSDIYINVPSEINALANDLAKGLDPATTNPCHIPVDAIRWNSTNGFWEKFTGTTWSALVSVYRIVVAEALKLKTAVTLAFSGDVLGSGSFDGSQNITVAMTLPNVNSNAGTVGSATMVPIVTANQKGQITDLNSVAIRFPTAPVLSVCGRIGAVNLTANDVTTALGFTPYNVSNPSAYITGITSSMVTNALGYVPLGANGSGATGTWPISVNGNAATVGGVSASELASLEYVNQNLSLLQNFLSLSVGGTKSIGSSSALLFSTMGGQQGNRGTYYTNMFYFIPSGKNGIQAVNIGGCRLTLSNYSNTKILKISLSALINFAADDTYGFQIKTSAGTVTNFGSYSARGQQNISFGFYTIPVNTTINFDLYASILSGSAGDSLYINAFTASYVQFI